MYLQITYQFNSKVQHVEVSYPNWFPIIFYCNQKRMQHTTTSPECDAQHFAALQ